MRLLIVGDSAALGVGAGCQRQALSGQLVSFLGEHFRVTWKLHAATGRTIKDVVTLLEAAAPKKVDVLVLQRNIYVMEFGQLEPFLSVFIAIHADLTLAFLKALFDRPAHSGGLNQFGN